MNSGESTAHDEIKTPRKLIPLAFIFCTDDNYQVLYTFKIITKEKFTSVHILRWALAKLGRCKIKERKKREVTAQ